MQNKPQNNIPVFRQVSYPFLPSLTSSYFFFSEDGLMWFSTVRGLASFDGTEAVYHCSMQEANELSLNKIGYIVEDAQHNFYIATRYNLIFFNRKEKKFYSLKKLFSAFETSVGLGILFIKIEKNGTMFMGSYSRGMFIYDPSQKNVEHINLDTGKPDKWESRYYNTAACFADHATDSTKLWVGSFNGIYLFDKKNKTLSKNFIITTPLYNGLGEEKSFYDVEKMDVADDSTIWFNIWSGGFCSYNTHTGKVVIYGQDDNLIKGKPSPLYIIPSFVKLSSGSYLLGSNRSGVFDTKTKAIDFLGIITDPNARDAVTYCDKDKRDNIWLIRNGLLYVSIPEYSRLQYVNIRKTNLHHNENEMRGVYFDEVNQLYYFAVRFSNGIYVLDTNFKILNIIPSPLFTNKYSYRESCTDKITKDGSGRFWVTGWETYVLLPGQKKFDHVGHTFSQLNWINKKGEFFDVLTSRSGNILLRGITDVYMINHKTLTVDTIKIPRFDNKGNFRITLSPLSYDSLRDCIYLSNEYGIAQYQIKAKLTRTISYKEIFGDTIAGQRILKYTIDAEGKVWLLKDQYGIRILDPKSLKCIDSIPLGKRGLMSGLYTDITGGGCNYMFLQGQHGVVIYNYMEERSFLFDNSNGLSYPLAYSMLYSNHHLFLGQANSIEYYNTENFPKNNFILQPKLNTLTVDTTEIYGGIYKSGEEIKLPYHKNNISLSFSASEFIFPERIEYAYMLTGVDNVWKYSNYFTRKVNYSNLQPGKYVFKIRAQQFGGNWGATVKEYTIIITPPFWQTWWFRAIGLLIAAGIIYFLLRLRLQYVRKQERQRAKQEKELIELEAKALRAQMNPHFIFNCLNSIKSLIQQHQEEKSVNYLTTFSKLIRTLFNNADKKEISLHDEIETCKLYLQLEAMRFDAKFSHSVNVDENIDLKSIQVPALIIQPFIENAIWHGIVPREAGGRVEVNVKQVNDSIEVIIDDNGIGREASGQNKASSGLAHQSKGMNLTQSRLDLENRLNETNARLETIDKKDDNGQSAGTRIVLTFSKY
jgi:two-component sensor histidine kinase